MFVSIQQFDILIVEYLVRFALNLIILTFLFLQDIEKKTYTY